MVFPVAKKLDEKQTKEILEVKIEDITLEQLKDWFADKDGKKHKYNTFDIIEVPANRIGNRLGIITTLGRYIFNGFVLAKLHTRIPFVGDEFNGKNIEKLNNRLAKMLVEDKITSEEFIDYFNRQQWLGFTLVSFLAPSINMEDLKCPPKTARLRKELFSKYAKEIKEVNVKVISDIEKQILESAKEELKGSEIMDLFNSGARGKFNTNYKCMSLMRGLIPKVGENGFYCSMDNLLDGSSPDDQYKYNNIMITGAVGRAVETQVYGYLAKQLNAAFQGADIDKEGSDCGTKLTLDVKITEWNKEKLLYSYIVENGKLVLLDSETINKYVGKVVKKRSPMFCKSQKICEKCFGKLPYMLGIQKIGLIVSRMEEAMKNLSMKKFHDSSVKLIKFDINDYITEIKSSK